MAKWTLPELKPNQNYKNSYRITARFFAWIENHVKSGTIKSIDQSLRNHTYNEETWKDLTGKNLNELWADYLNNPSIT